MCRRKQRSKSQKVRLAFPDIYSLIPLLALWTREVLRGDPWRMPGQRVLYCPWLLTVIKCYCMTLPQLVFSLRLMVTLSHTHVQTLALPGKVLGVPHGALPHPIHSVCRLNKAEKAGMILSHDGPPPLAPSSKTWSGMAGETVHLDWRLPCLFVCYFYISLSSEVRKVTAF